MSIHYRQGDVLIRKVDRIPSNSTEVRNHGRIVLAFGEVTGHAHAVTACEAQEFTFVDTKKATHRFLEVFDRGATVTHEEHAPIPLPAGLYEIIRQREYTPVSERSVAD